MSFDPEQALQRVAEVFRERGYEGTSLQNLLAATGLSKSSLYQQYGNKQALFDQCLMRYAQGVEADLKAALAQADSGRAFIDSVLQQVISESAPSSGCLIFNTASDLSQLDAQVADAIRQVLGRYRAVFMAAIEQDQAAGLIRQDSAAVDLANYLMGSIAGLHTLVKGGMQAAELRRCCDLIMKAL